MKSGRPIDSAPSIPGGRGRADWRTVLVILSFAWLLAIVGLVIWAGRARQISEQEAPRLIAVVDESLRSADIQDPRILAKLESANLAEYMGSGVDVLSMLPKVQGARPAWYSVDRSGNVILGYIGESIAEDVCVRSVVRPGMDVSTTRVRCSDWE